jgi:hypothetical protein
MFLIPLDFGKVFSFKYFFPEHFSRTSSKDTNLCLYANINITSDLPVNIWPPAPYYERFKYVISVQ